MVLQNTKVEKKDNVSTTMLFPCLKIKQDLVSQFPKFGFDATYLYCPKYYYDFNVMYIVFKPEFTLPFHLFLTELEKNVNFIETIDEAGVVILVYRIPPKFGIDYLLFLNGAYSRTSPDFKACFQLKVYKQGANGEYLKTPTGSYQTEYTIYYHIFNKTDFLRNRWMDTLEVARLPKDMELYDKCDISKETLVI